MQSNIRYNIPHIKLLYQLLILSHNVFCIFDCQPTVEPVYHALWVFACRPSDLPDADACFDQLSKELKECVAKNLMSAAREEQMSSQLSSMAFMTNNTPLKDLYGSSDHGKTLNSLIQGMVRLRTALVNSDEFKRTYPDCTIAVDRANEVRGC